VQHEAVAHLAHGQLAVAAEVQQHQSLVAGEGQVEGLQGIVDLGDQDLLRPHDRRDGGHVGRRGPGVRLPLPAGLGDGVEVERTLAPHGA
jgi:hypothetical protein